MEKDNRRKNIRRVGTMLLGCFLVAIGINNFAVALDLPMSGITGFAIIINRLTGLNIGLMTIVINIPLALLCFRLLGRRFFLQSVACMFFVSLMIDYIAPLFPMFEGSRMLAAIVCGVVSGAGFALVIGQQASTGGTTFIALAIKNKVPHIPVGKVLFLLDLVPVALAGILFDDFDGIIYGLITSFLFSVMIERLIRGANAGALLLIVTDHSEKISEIIGGGVRRGCTVWQAKGGYQGDSRDVLMCACSKHQVPALQESITEIDPRSFTVLLDTSEVQGNGFERLIIAKREE